MHHMQKEHQPRTEDASPLVCTKEPFKQLVAPRKIQRISFGIQNPQEIVKCGTFLVYENRLYKLPERVPHPNGPLDRRLGVSSKNHTCETCNQKLADCAGHFAYIKLQLPVFHIGYHRNTIQILSCICKTCSRVLLMPEDRAAWLRRFRNPRVERVARQGMFRKVVEACKKVKVCPHCGSYNGVVKKASGSLKIIHDKYNKNVSLMEDVKEGLNEAMRWNDQIKQNLHRIADDITPLRALELLRLVPQEDCEVLDLSMRPEHLIVTHVAVPPVAIRPSVEMDGQSNEDDITMKLLNIIEVNNSLRHHFEKGLPTTGLLETWDFLQVQCATLINSDLPGLPSTFQQPGRPTRGFVQRLKGKQGRFRGNLSGKRVDFSGRTVISPDPNLRVDQVCVPQHMAVILTFPERVTPHNVDKLRARVINGVTVWPGANFVLQPDGSRFFLKFVDRRKVAAELKVGDVVERHLDDGDVVLFNRQPSLHRISIMAFRAKVRTWRTLRFNECVCSPFNADFDGDEMNLHLPQTQEARAEAITLMASVNNLCTPKNGEILIAATQDFLTFAFLVTSKDVFLTRAEMCLLCSFMSDACEHVDLPSAAIIKPLELWTGKQLFSLIVRPNVRTRVFVNLELPEKRYSKKDTHLCPADGWVCFRNSELVCGRVGKVVLGGSKGGLFGTLNSDYSAATAAACMTRLSKVAARHMGNRGFSIGIDDVTPSPRLQAEKAALLQQGNAKCDNFIAQYRKGDLELQAGCNLEQSLESQVMGVLNNIREQAGKLCMDTLHWHNSPLIMSWCGSKGSPINIAQMVACVGQQSVGGKRCFEGFTARTLPHFPRGDKTPAGKGFVANSFFSGLTPTEFFFHTMAGREGLVDTAVKTAETGYMSRRLMKALEDLYVHYDGTVRNAAGGIVQLTYGDDGMDPVLMEGAGGWPLDLEKTLATVRAHTRRRPLHAGGLHEVSLPAELSAQVAAEVQLHALLQRRDTVDGCSASFADGLSDFLQQQVLRYRAARKALELPQDARGGDTSEYVAGTAGLTPRQLRNFVATCVRKYEHKRIEPGSTVGAVGAQSIGEPGTQMTLKTFHFAGVASMNVTLGVPRIKEIINASRSISTPIMRVQLAVDRDVKAARVVKGRLEKTMLGQVAASIKIVLKPGSSEAYISVRLDMAAIAALQLGLDAHAVAMALLRSEKPRLRLKAAHVRPQRQDKLLVLAPDGARTSLLFQLEALLLLLPQVIVSGVPTIERAVISRDEDDKTRFVLLVEGTNLQAAMATTGVRGEASSTNHVFEIERFLGIEAARKCIIKEISYTMSSHGMSIDARHMMLLADCMTYKGEVLGITRVGISKMKDSVLHTASFEKTADHLFDAALHSRSDDVVGVSESIIMGAPMPTGTGLFRLKHNVGALRGCAPRPPPLLAYDMRAKA